jgi:hypothetical protein
MCFGRGSHAGTPVGFAKEASVNEAFGRRFSEKSHRTTNLETSTNNFRFMDAFQQCRL